MKEPQYNPKDVREVAAAIVNDCLFDQERGLHEHTICAYCGRWQYSTEFSSDFEHDPSCVVLIARDLLTK